MSVNNTASATQMTAQLGEDELDLSQIISIIWSGRWAIAVAVTISCLSGLIYLLAANPLYEADGTVQVEEEGKNVQSSSLSDITALFGAPVETEAEIQILQSRLVLNKVIDNLNLLIEAEPKYFPVLGRFVASHLRKSGEISNAPLGLTSFAWSSESIDVAKFEVPSVEQGQKYTLTAIDTTNYSLEDPDGFEVLKGEVGTKASAQSKDGPVEIFVRDLQSRPGTRFVVTRSSRAAILKWFKDTLKVEEQGKQSAVIGLTIKSHQAVTSVQIIQQIEDAYLRQNVERRSSEAALSLQFLDKQLPEIKASVDEAQAKLNAYQNKQGSVDVTKETELVLQQSVDLEARRLDLIGQREQAIQRYTSQHPIVQALDAQIRGFDAEQAAIKKRTEKLPETQQEVLSLMRDLDVNTQLYTTVLDSAQTLQVAKAGTLGNVRIIDYPLVPDRKASPKANLIFPASFILGLILGIGYIFVQKALFRGVDRPDEIERLLGLPTYAAIPYTPVQKVLSQAVRKKQGGKLILADAEPDNVAIEALRSLRTSLQFALLESPNNVVMFTGPTPGLGKSFVSVNLAAVLAKSGKKVVVIDGDLRRGHLHKYITQTATPGLSDFIVGNSDLQSVVRSTGLDGLSMVTNGTNAPNPSELLLHDRFQLLLNSLSKSHDLVIVDTPPVLPVSDASVIGRLAGCVLLVLKEGEHPMRMVEETIRRLKQSGVQVRGTIFNQVGQRAGGYGYYYNSYGYSYSNKYGTEKR